MKLRKLFHLVITHGVKVLARGLIITHGVKVPAIGFSNLMILKAETEALSGSVALHSWKTKLIACRHQACCLIPTSFYVELCSALTVGMNRPRLTVNLSDGT